MDQTEEDFLTDNLTMEECSSIAKNACGPDATVLKYDLRLNCEGVCGFMAEYFELYLTVKMDTGKCENHTFFIKSLPILNKAQRELVEGLGVFKCEMFLCGHLFPELKKYRIQKWCPEYYLTRSDIIVMEDLFKNGYTHIGDTDFLSMEQLRAVLRCMARMHANSINYELKTGVNIGERYPVLNYECSVNMKQGWFRAGLMGIQLIAQMHPKLQSGEYKTFVNEALRSSLEPMFDKVKTTKKFKSVFCHRDAWGKNIFFKTNVENDVKTIDCLLVDFQISRYLPPSMDVLFFLHLNTRRQFREEKLRELLQFYYESLSDTLKEAEVDVNEVLTWEGFLDSCEYVKLVPLVLTGVYIPTTYTVRDLMRMRQKDPERYHHLVTVDRNDFIRESMEKDPYLKDYCFEIVGELVEYLMTVKNTKI